MSEVTTRKVAGTTRRRRVTVTIVIVLVFLGLAVTNALLQPGTSTRPHAPDNPDPHGAMAVAQILDDQGIDVHDVTTWAELTHRAGPGTTIFLPRPTMVTADQYEQLVTIGADIVLAAPHGHWGDLADLLPVERASTDRQVFQAECEDPHATAAHRAETTGSLVYAPAGSGVELCFPNPEDPRAGIYAVWQEGEATVRFLAAPELLTNEHLAEHGHAALALRSLGQHEDLLWYLPGTIADSTPDTGEADPPLLPPAVLWAGAVLLVAVVVLGINRLRGLGPVVTELMPVVVRSAETTRGRGRLYRRGGDRPHAAEALRAGAASRIARALNLPRSANRNALVDAVARTTGRAPVDVDALLYGTSPTDDDGLLILSAMLDALEREVQRT